MAKSLPSFEKEEYKKNTSILFLVNDINFFLSHRLALATAAQRQGYDIWIAVPEKTEVEKLKRYNFNIFTIYFDRVSKNPVKELRCFISIYRLLRKQRPNVVHLITAKPIFYGGLAARALGIPALAALTGMGYVYTHNDLKARTIRFFASFLYRMAINHPLMHALFQNHDDLAIAKKSGFIRRATTSIIGGSGTDLTKITPKPLPKGPIVVLMPSRMIRDKGVMEFVEAAQLLRAKGVNTIFRLLGDPDLNNPTSLNHKILEEWVAEGVIEWQPFSADIDSALALCHIVALPSYREGFPKAIIDAAAAGRAVVVSDVPGCRDAVIDGVTGRLCKVRSSESLAAVLEEMISDRQSLSRMGEAARSHAEAHFDTTEVENAHLRIYADLTRRSH